MFFSKIAGLFTLDLGVDLGTTNTHISVGGRGVVLSEPSVVAVRKGTTDVLCDGSAIGQLAKTMLGRTPGSIDAVRPLEGGVVADFDLTRALLEHFFRKAAGPRSLRSPRVLLAVPSGINEIEKRAIFDAAERAGARKVLLLEEPRAAGLGAGLPIHEARAHMIVDIGGGTTDISILSLADVVTSTSVRVAGDAMDEAIQQYLRRNFSIVVGRNTAEEIKIQLGSATRLDDAAEESLTVSGRDLIAGVPRAVTVSAADIRDALAESVQAILDAIRGVLEKTGPELSGDLVSTGMTLCGGGVLLRGLPEVIEEETGLRAQVAEDPLRTVARGTALFLEHLDAFQGILETADDQR